MNGSIRLHAAHGRLWVDWIHGAGLFGHTESQPASGWTAPGFRGWTDGSWVGIESVRQEIGRALFAP